MSLYPSNINSPRMHTSEPLSDSDFAKFNAEPITARDWLEIGHAVVGWFCAIGICFVVGFLVGVNLR